jgi:hypothetical protein
MAEIRINTTGGLKLYDADNSHYAQIVAGTITSNVDAITLGHDTVTIADNLSLGSDSAILKFGADTEIALTHVADTGLKLTDSGGTPTLQLHDANESIASDGSKVIITSGGTAFSLPTSDGSSGQVLSTNGSGVLSFATASSADPSSADGDSLGTASAEWSDLFLADGGIVYFGNDQDIRLTHNADKGLIIKHSATADDKPVILTLQTGETDMAANDVIGKIEFQAPDEGTGTDAILVSGAIQAVAEGDHSSSSNATRLEFMTGASEAATAKMSISSGGIVGMGAVPTGDLGEGLHIKTSDTGGGAANNSKELVIESNHASGGGMTITSKNDATGRIQFGDGDANSRFEVSYNHSTDKFQLSTAAAVAVAIDQAGIVSKPLQPASLYTAGDYDNLTGDGTTGDLGQTAGWGLTERWDNNADSVDGIFTAPVTGTYIIAGQVWVDDIASNHNELLIQMTTSNRTYYVAMDPHELGRSSGNSIGIPICAIADMDANDTHVLKIGVGGGSKVVDLISLTSVGIALIC